MGYYSDEYFILGVAWINDLKNCNSCYWCAPTNGENIRRGVRITMDYDDSMGQYRPQRHYLNLCSQCLQRLVRGHRKKGTP